MPPILRFWMLIHHIFQIQSSRRQTAAKNYGSINSLHCRINVSRLKLDLSKVQTLIEDDEKKAWDAASQLSETVIEMLCNQQPCIDRDKLNKRIREMIDVSLVLEPFNPSQSFMEIFESELSSMWNECLTALQYSKLSFPTMLRIMQCPK